jgi:FKBP-type peptidyl-prolyl cis-trans isomerase FklB
MRKFIVIAALIVSTATISAGTARAQQPAAAPANPQPAAQDKTTTPPAAKPAKPAATKSGTASGAKTTAPLTLTTTKAKLSYALGMNFGENLHKQSVEVDPSIVVRGMKDGLVGGKTLMTDDEARAAINDLMAGLRKQREEANKAFLATNKSKEGVVTLPSGLQYKILQAGTGPKPTASDSVVCQYRGTLIDGKEFDSSYKRGQPATFPVSGVIKGWTEALQLMPAGSKWQLFVPSELAYGPQGMPPAIGPNATLVFEVELISIQEKAK